MKPIDMSNFKGRRKAGVDYSVALRDLLPGLIGPGHSPKSKRELAAATGRNFETLTRLFAKMHGTQIRIAGWRRGRSGNPTALWTLGPGEDAPELPALTSAEKCKRYRSTENGHRVSKEASKRWKESPEADEYLARYNQRRMERYYAVVKAKKVAKETLTKIDPLLSAIMGRMR